MYLLFISSFASFYTSNHLYLLAFTLYFRYKRALDEGRKIAMQNYWVLACGVSSILFLMYLSYGFAFYFGAGLVVNGFCAPGSIFTVSNNYFESFHQI